MTYRELLKVTHPECVSGECAGCPGSYFIGGPNNEACPCDGSCTECWDQEATPDQTRAALVLRPGKYLNMKPIEEKKYIKYEAKRSTGRIFPRRIRMMNDTIYFCNCSAGCPVGIDCPNHVLNALKPRTDDPMVKLVHLEDNPDYCKKPNRYGYQVKEPEGEKND